MLAANLDPKPAPKAKPAKSKPAKAKAPKTKTPETKAGERNKHSAKTVAAKRPMKNKRNHR